VKATWNGNVTDADAGANPPPPLLCDTTMVIVTRFARPGKHLERLAKRHPTRSVPLATVRTIWCKWVSKAQKGLRIDGEPIIKDKTAWRRLTTARGAPREVWVNDYRLEAIRRAVPGWTRITQARNATPVYRAPIVFWFGKQPVALLMCMHSGSAPVADETKGDQK